MSERRASHKQSTEHQVLVAEQAKPRQSPQDLLVRRVGGLSGLPDHRTALPLRQAAVLQLQQRCGNEVVRRVLSQGNLAVRAPDIQRQQPHAAQPAAQPGAGLAQNIVDNVVRDQIVSVLSSYQSIPIEVVGSRPLPAGQVGPPAPVRVTVNVRAAYFINTERARQHYRRRRSRARFSAIVRALRREVSLLETGRGGRLTAGQAVRYGKATPEDIKKFVEEALTRDVIRRYARRNNLLNANQQLVDLPIRQLTGVIQRWIYHVAIGVDCTGFAQVAAIRAREAVRARARAAGVPAAQLPPAPGHGQRPARGARVQRPSNLRPGDLWTTNRGQHVRIVIEARQVTLPGGNRTVEFDTAESSGGSIQPRPGQVRRSWRTRSLNRFHRIRRVNHNSGPVDGYFNRIR